MKPDTDYYRKVDGGAKSRKLWFSLYTSSLIVLSGYVCSILPAMVPLFDTMVGGLVGVLALYLGGNVGARFATKAPVPPAAPAAPNDGPPIEGGPAA